MRRHTRLQRFQVRFCIASDSDGALIAMDLDQREAEIDAFNVPSDAIRSSPLDEAASRSRHRLPSCPPSSQRIKANNSCASRPPRKTSSRGPTRRRSSRSARATARPPATKSSLDDARPNAR